MRQAGAGKIINLESLAGLTAIPFIAFYCATKFALEAYSESLWHELKPFGITVTLIEPGWVRTAISHGSRAAAGTLPIYEGPRNRATAVIGRAVEEGLSPEVVAKFVLRAATSRQPRLRSRVGADAQWLPRVKELTSVEFVCIGRPPQVCSGCHQQVSNGEYDQKLSRRFP